MIHKTMRSILSVLLAALLLVTSTPLTPAFAGGGGAVSPQSESGEGRALEQADDGVYQISTAAELKEFRDEVNSGKTDADAVLTANIDLSSVCSKEKGNWAPIGNSINQYRGTFNGNGHTISSLYIDSSDNDYKGLFGYLSTDGNNTGTVQNLTVSGSVSGGWYVGGVVGRNGGNVINCTFSGSVSGHLYVGGVVGQNGGTVENCYNTGSVSGNSVGGVVGYNSSTVENCYNTGTVTGSGGLVGGVVGYNDTGATVSNCYNIGTVTGSGDRSNVGGVVGDNYGSVTNCYFLSSTAASGIGGGKPSEDAKSLTADQFKKQENFTKWDFGTADTTTWSIHPVLGRPVLNENKEGGLGTDKSPYEISTATQLETFRDIVNGASGNPNPNAHAKLMNDIDLSSVCEPTPDDGTSWIPIGNSIGNSYEGTFNGDGHTISGLYIDSDDNDYKGLFGYVYGGTVKNLNVSGSVKGDDYVGGVVGYNNGGTVTGCIFSGSGSVSGVTGSDYVGGIVGYNGTGATVSNCYNTGTGTVTGTVDSVGGVVGQNFGGVKNCYNTVTVTGSDYVGGIVGDNFGGTVENCYNTGTVTGTDDYVGGVVGYNGSSSTIENCYYQQHDPAIFGIGDTTKDDTRTVAKTAEQFASGEVAWLLQKGQTAGAGGVVPLVWGQSNLTATTSLPTLVALDKANAQTVYKVTFDYGALFTDNDKHYAYSYTNGVVSEPTKNPELDGHTLSGWYSDESLTTAWNFSTAVTENMTLYAQWTAVEDPDPEPEEPPYSGKYSYEISTDIGDNGAISVDRYATEGDEVTITVSPDDAYLLDDLSVTAGGKDVELIDNHDGTFSFTMPSADVRITATFAEDPDWTEPEEPATDVSDLFIDIAPDAWYKDAVQYAYDNGLMTGVSDTEFAPEATTTRAMIVSILARLEGVTTAQAAGFADVDDNDWYATAVNWAASVGVVNGYEDNTFQPNTAITREQLAAILMNYAAYKGEDVSNRADLTSYTDQPSTWAEEAMSWAVAEGLISGVTADTLQPQGAATRAQVAAILQRFLTK